MSYTTAKAVPTIKRIELLDKKKFAKAALDKESETFVMYILSLETPLAGTAIYPS